jgi:hypothetical protein
LCLAPFFRHFIYIICYGAGDANNLISNFKKGVEKKNRPAEWRYKEDAIVTFAKELAILDMSNLIVTCVPSSKCKTDPLYDDRLEQTLQKLQGLRPGTVVEYPYRIRATIPAAHLGGGRDIQSFYQNLVWLGFQSQNVNTIVIVDDVITSGCKFKACKQLILEHHPDAMVIGLFWGRTVWSQ